MRDVILPETEDLLHGKVSPRTVADLGDAVGRAKQNGAIRRVSAR